MPSDIEEYVHRIGRTGRVGNLGKYRQYFIPDVLGAVLLAEWHIQTTECLRKAFCDKAILLVNSTVLRTASLHSEFGGVSLLKCYTNLMFVKW